MTTVVIVDDEVVITEILSEYFEIEKIKVVGVGYDGQQAVELCTQFNPDFLILDLSMPKFDGFYALKKLRNTSTKIILHTGLIDEATLQRLDSFPIFSIQYKPVNFSNFLEIMKPI